jgi:co-chaperonin GroES (HSP10)
MKTQPNKSQLQPTGELIVVEPLPDPDIVAGGGIALAGTAERGDKYGRVLAVGPGVHQYGVLVQPKVEVGDTVMFRGGRGLKLRLQMEDVLFMTERDFLAVIKE